MDAMKMTSNIQPINSESPCNRKAKAAVMLIADSDFLLEDYQMDEIWKDIKGWEGIYQISNYGRLKSFLKDPNGYIRSIKNKTGWYLGVVLTGKGKKPQSVKIHKLVILHFVPNPGKKPDVNHKDLNKQNNHADNLEWVTPKENYDHGTENGIDFQAGMNNYNKYIRPRSVMQLTLKGTLIKLFPNCAEASRETKICLRNIHQVASKTEYKPGLIRSQAGGYRWEFYGN